MRSFFLLLLAAIAGAADQETLVLKDGRTLTGTYDENAEILTVENGKSSMQVRIKKRDIVTREKIEPIKAKAALPATNETASAKSGSETQYADLEIKIHDLEAKAETLGKKFRELREASESLKRNGVDASAPEKMATDAANEREQALVGLLALRADLRKIGETLNKERPADMSAAGPFLGNRSDRVLSAFFFGGSIASEAAVELAL